MNTNQWLTGHSGLLLEIQMDMNGLQANYRPITALSKSKMSYDVLDHWDLEQVRVGRTCNLWLSGAKHISIRISWTTWPGKVTRILSFGAFVEVAPPSGGEAVRGVAEFVDFWYIFVDLLYWAGETEAFYISERFGMATYQIWRTSVSDHMSFLSWGPTDASLADPGWTGLGRWHWGAKSPDWKIEVCIIMYNIYIFIYIKDSVHTRSTCFYICLLNVVYYARRCSKLW